MYLKSISIVRLVVDVKVLVVYRAELNVLLCGDPGTSKSQLLQYVHNIVPRGQYTSGKGSSAVGLTAYVTKDAETKQLVLQTYVSYIINPQSKQINPGNPIYKPRTELSNSPSISEMSW